MEQTAETDGGKPLYGKQTSLTLENMSFSGRSLSEFPLYIRSAAQVKKSCARANRRAGLLGAESAARIESACEALETGRYDGQFPVDVFHGGGGIGINMNLNEVIAALAGPGMHPVDDVNLSQSTSDVCHTALRIALIRLLDELHPVLNGLCQGLDERARAFTGVDTIARTCMQDGMRVPASALFQAVSAALARQRERLSALRGELHSINLGWTVVGSGTGASDGYRRYILEELGAATGLPLQWAGNLYDAAEDPDDLARLSAQVRVTAELLSKFARDLRLLASGPEAGLRELRLPAVQAGSSFFPGKVNPVIPEMMIQCGMLIAGNDTVIQNALGLGEIHLNLWEELMGFLLMENLMRLIRAAGLFLRLCVSGIEVNREQCEAYAAGSVPLIVDYKERFGYEALSEQIRRDGLSRVISRLKAGQTERKETGNEQLET